MLRTAGAWGKATSSGGVRPARLGQTVREESRGRRSAADPRQEITAPQDPESSSPAKGKPENRPGAGGRHRHIAAAVAVALLALVGFLMRDRLPTTSRPRVVVLYCFSVLNEAMEDGVLPAFRDHWQQQTGERVEFLATYAGSGSIVDRILQKVPAEVAVLSSELDAYRIPAHWESWRELPHGGVLGRTPVVLFVRPGNPLGIQGFEDLAGGGLEIVHPDPATSGGSNLAILAEYGSALESDRGGVGGGDLAGEQLLAVWRNVTVLAPSAREARRRFLEGAGDVLITYEMDLLANPSRSGPAGRIVYPPRTLLAEPVVTRIEKNIDQRQRPVIDALVEFLWSREAQEILVRYGLCSADQELNGGNPDLGVIADPFTLADLGGAVRARREILDAIWRNRPAPAE